MDARIFVNLLENKSIDFFTGVPDSLLSGLCNYLIGTAEDRPARHVIAHNEGGSVALASGYHLATGKIPCVYLQNSGIGNIINPAASLIHSRIYGIPILFLVGWRGEPDTHDEPQHLYQGEATLRMLESVEIEYFILGQDTTEKELETALDDLNILFKQGKSAAIAVKKNAISGPKGAYTNCYTIVREQAINHIARTAGNGVLVSTTGKISRELFETREHCGGGHAQDFLTVGSMGHSSMIALGIAQEKPEFKIWCIDGDGAMLMHMGAVAMIGSQKPPNFVHIVLNNAAHESVGGAPTVAEKIDLSMIAKACGYREALSVSEERELEPALHRCANEQGPFFLEIKVALRSREDLGRPTTTPVDNKDLLMAYLKGAIE